MRLDMESGGHRYAVCVASYGYMGDLMRLSERLRFLGPARYGLAGAITLLRGRAYNAEVCSPDTLERHATFKHSGICIITLSMGMSSRQHPSSILWCLRTSAILEQARGQA